MKPTRTISNDFGEFQSAPQIETGDGNRNKISELFYGAGKQEPSSHWIVNTNTDDFDPFQSHLENELPHIMEESEQIAFDSVINTYRSNRNQLSASDLKDSILKAHHQSRSDVRMTIDKDVPDPVRSQIRPSSTIPDFVGTPLISTGQSEPKVLPQRHQTATPPQMTTKEMQTDPINFYELAQLQRAADPQFTKEDLPAPKSSIRRSDGTKSNIQLFKSCFPTTLVAEQGQGLHSPLRQLTGSGSHLTLIAQQQDSGKSRHRETPVAKLRGVLKPFFEEKVFDSRRDSRQLFMRSFDKANLYNRRTKSPIPRQESASHSRNRCGSAPRAAIFGNEGVERETSTRLLKTNMASTYLESKDKTDTATKKLFNNRNPVMRKMSQKLLKRSGKKNNFLRDLTQYHSQEIQSDEFRPNGMYMSTESNDEVMDNIRKNVCESDETKRRQPVVLKPQNIDFNHTQPDFRYYLLT